MEEVKSRGAESLFSWLATARGFDTHTDDLYRLSFSNFQKPLHFRHFLFFSVEIVSPVH